MGTNGDDNGIVFKPDQSKLFKLINSKGAEHDSLLYIMDVVLPSDKKRVVVNKMKDDLLYNSGGVKDVGLYAHVAKGGSVHYYKAIYIGFGVYNYSLLDRNATEDFLIRHQDGLNMDNLKKYGFDLFNEDV